MHNEYGASHRLVQRQVFWSSLSQPSITAGHR
jgi:hypothetical protein